MLIKKLSLKFLITDNIDLRFSDESDDFTDEYITSNERTYRGPHLTFPLQKKEINTLIDLFRKKKVSINGTKFIPYPINKLSI